MPDITMTILDGQLGLVPPSVANAVVHAGICSGGVVNQLYSFGDTSTAKNSLGQGPLTENVGDTLAVAGQCLAVPLNPSVAGSVGGTTQVGTLGGTVTGSLVPAVVIDFKISTGGTLGTMQMRWRINAGAYSNPVTSTGGSFPFLVPGTLTTATFAAATYVLNDVYTISLLGVITVVGTGPASNVTQVSSPLDSYQVLVTITTGGALGVAVFTYSVDNGNNTSGQILVPGGGTFAIPNTGVKLTFASTFVAGETYTFACVAAGFGTGDVSAMLTALGNQATEWALVHIVGQGANSAAAASMAATVDTSMTAFETAYRYVFGVVECPTSESDATVAAAFAAFNSSRVMVTAGDIDHISSISVGRVIRRNCGPVVVSRLAKVQPSEDPGWVGSPAGSLKNVKAIYRDEGKTPLLAANRFTVLQTRPKRPGYYVTRGLMMAAPGSDYTTVMNRRVMDVACNTTFTGIEPMLNQALLVNKATGAIYDPEANRIEGFINGQLAAVLLSPSPPDASSAKVVVNRTENILSTSNLTVDVRVVPKGYARTIKCTIGFSNPGLGT